MQSSKISPLSKPWLQAILLNCPHRQIFSRPSLCTSCFLREMRKKREFLTVEVKKKQPFNLFGSVQNITYKLPNHIWYWKLWFQLFIERSYFLKTFSIGFYSFGTKALIYNYTRTHVIQWWYIFDQFSSTQFQNDFRPVTGLLTYQFSFIRENVQTFIIIQNTHSSNDLEKYKLGDDVI